MSTLHSHLFISSPRTFLNELRWLELRVRESSAAARWCGARRKLCSSDVTHRLQARISEKRAPLSNVEQLLLTCHAPFLNSSGRQLAARRAFGPNSAPKRSKGECRRRHQTRHSIPNQPIPISFWSRDYPRGKQRDRSAPNGLSAIPYVWPFVELFMQKFLYCNIRNLYNSEEKGNLLFLRAFSWLRIRTKWNYSQKIFFNRSDRGW